MLHSQDLPRKVSFCSPAHLFWGGFPVFSLWPWLASLLVLPSPFFICSVHISVYFCKLEESGPTFKTTQCQTPEIPKKLVFRCFRLSHSVCLLEVSGSTVHCFSFFSFWSSCCLLKAVWECWQLCVLSTWELLLVQLNWYSHFRELTVFQERSSSLLPLILHRHW